MIAPATNATATIIQSRGNVQGLTTGAAMWLTGAVGVAVGFGLYVIAVLTTILALLILVVLSLIPIPKVNEDGQRD